MPEENTERIAEGRELLQDHLAKIKETAEAFLGALKGFRRDLTLSSQATGKILHGEFNETAGILVVPSVVDGNSFADLSEMLHLTTHAFFGKILMEKGNSAALQEEIGLTHKNLTDVSETANRLYEALKTASYEFDVFNTKNIEAEFPEANIAFDRDGLNLSIETARALGEYAVRLDIDLMEYAKKFE